MRSLAWGKKQNKKKNCPAGSCPSRFHAFKGQAKHMH